MFSRENYYYQSRQKICGISFVILNQNIYMCELMRDKNYDWIKIVLAENYLPNKYLAGKSGRDQEVISNSKWVTNSVSLR